MTDELDPEELARWTAAFADDMKAEDDLKAERRARNRRARRRYRFEQALWTGIAAAVILLYVAWTLRS